MERFALQKLIDWKSDPERKPMIIKGARQVGKTWLMQEFGRTCYSNYVYFNFELDPPLNDIFKRTKEPKRIVELLSILAHEKILPEETLIIFDEIQNCPDALNSLKYFKEMANEYHVITAGSLLGVPSKNSEVYPVGQVNLLNIYPLTFDEFLMNMDSSLYKYFQEIKVDTQVVNIFSERLFEYFTKYLIIGGMPEAVSSWNQYKDPARIKNIHKELVTIYKNDIVKHNSKIDSGKILLVFNNIVSQLAKPNKKFVYEKLRTGARARDFERAINWLVSADLAIKVCNLKKIDYPLSVYEDENKFKLYFFDIGLLKYMAELDDSAILLNKEFQFKGPFIENYVLQQLLPKFDHMPRYFMDQNSELDFILQHDSEIIPCEVKSGVDKSAPSFKRYIKETNPKYAFRFSRRDLRVDGKIINVPLYLSSKVRDLL